MKYLRKFNEMTTIYCVKCGEYKGDLPEGDTCKFCIDKENSDETMYKFWEVWFISCEGNKRVTTARSPIDWDEYEVRNNIQMGGCGDDISEITSIEETGISSDDEYGLDLT